jgi:ATP-dependent Clp protease ATP-binding subunit ClpA
MPFRFDKFTIKAQEAVQSAVELAANRGNPQVTPVHLIQALLVEREGIVRPLLEKIGYSGQQTQEFLAGMQSADRRAAEKNVQDAQGFWKDGKTARPISETSKVLVRLHPANADSNAALDRIADAYKARFHQESVLRTDSQVCADFR